MTSRIRTTLVSLVIALSMGCGGDQTTEHSNTAKGKNGKRDNGNAMTEKETLSVSKFEPAANAKDVSVDQVIRIVFTRPVDAPLPDSAVVVKSASGELVEGRALADRRTVLFTPTRFAVNTTYTVTINTSVTSGKYKLASTQQVSFTTGESTSGNSHVPPADFNPLGPGTQVALGRIPEYAFVWTGSADTHLALEDPPYNPSPMLNRAAPGADSIGSVVSIPSLQRDKLPIVAQLDDDGEEEIAIFSADATGAISLAVADRTESGIEYKQPNLPFALADTFEAAAGDFDRDGRDELLLGISRSGERIRYYLVEYDPETEEYVIALSGKVGSEGSTAAEYVRIAAGDVDHDGMAEAIIAWHSVSTKVANSSNAYYVIHDDAKNGMKEMFPYRAIREGINWSFSAIEN